MLLDLHVKNMALIREEEVSFTGGLNILTGETGAGKSIIIGSVNIALGTGSFRDYVPDNGEDALVELVFETQSAKAAAMLEEAGISMEDGQVVISRKYHGGRSISRVNGETVNVSFIRELASELIDIHGQHEHQSLLHPEYHLALLDRYVQEELGSLPRECADAYSRWAGVRKELREALTDGKDRAKQADLLAYEIREIEEAAPVPGEDEELEAQFRRLSNGQKIMEALAEVRELTGYESGASDAVSRAVRALSQVSSYDETLAGLCDQLSAAEDLLSDFDRSVGDYIDEFSYDEQAFYEIGRRLDVLNHLKTKYGRTIGEVLEYLDGQKEKLDRLNHYEAYLEELKARQEKEYQALKACAGKISRVRKEGALVLQEKIRQALLDLNFLDVRFEIAFEELAEPSAGGMDRVCFMICLNPGMPLRPLQETASGGELSRVMLAIKSVMADQDAVETLIFDEIDTGISGRTAQKVSEKMNVIAHSHQVICITHLAQIAAMADTHFLIEKEAGSGSAATHIRPLDDTERIQELSRILGGVRVTDAVRESAAEMRALALEVKKTGR